jgi:hypothetical protein
MFRGLGNSNLDEVGEVFRRLGIQRDGVPELAAFANRDVSFTNTLALTYLSPDWYNQWYRPILV